MGMLGISRFLIGVLRAFDRFDAVASRKRTAVRKGDRVTVFSLSPYIVALIGSIVNGTAEKAYMIPLAATAGALCGRGALLRGRAICRRRGRAGFP